MLKARKAAHGGHEVGDTSTDPLVLTSEDEEMETPPPAMERVPENREYHQNDADYVLFLLKQSENEGPRNTSSPNSSAAPTQESSYSPPGYAPSPPRAKSKASKGFGIIKKGEIVRNMMVASTVEKTLLADMRELTRFELIHTSRLAENEEPVATSDGFGSPSVH
nr:uncharacterized protein LOC109166971 [Ipomoea batatas]